jgi:hypothetical protein
MAGEDRELRRLWSRANSLHQNFYEGWMPPEDVKYAVEDVKQFVEQLKKCSSAGPATAVGGHREPRTCNVSALPLEYAATRRLDSPNHTEVGHGAMGALPG